MRKPKGSKGFYLFCKVKKGKLAYLFYNVRLSHKTDQILTNKPATRAEIAFLLSPPSNQIQVGIFSKKLGILTFYR